MSRRPPGQGRHVAERQPPRPPSPGRHVAEQQQQPTTIKGILTLTLALASCVSAAHQNAPQQHLLQHQPHISLDVSPQPDTQATRRPGSPYEGPVVASHVSHVPNPRKTQAVPTVNNSRRGSYVPNDDVPNQDRTKYTHTTPNQHTESSTDASALATVAPGPPVAAPNSLQQRSTSSILHAGLSPLNARSLADWEVEDYALLATVDGHLYAVNKDTGEEHWNLGMTDPAVETLHNRTPPRTTSDRLDHQSVHRYIWAVEPTQDGPIYFWNPAKQGNGLWRTGLSMKQFVDGPVTTAGSPVVYTGDKKVEVVTLDAATGRVLKWFGGTRGSQINPGETCIRPNSLVDPTTEECSHTGTITLSRTTYTVTVQSQDDGTTLATLKYREWGPYFDRDLHGQYHETRDKRYFTTGNDGLLHAYDGSPSSHQHDRKEAYPLPFSLPVVRAFDVMRPFDAPRGSNPGLLLLPQPPPPVRDHDQLLRSSSIFLNRTGDGAWVAMSALSYPLMMEADDAMVLQDKQVQKALYDIHSDDPAASQLIGKHRLRLTIEDYDLAGQEPGASLPLGLPGPPPADTIGNESTAVMLGDENRVELFRGYVETKAKELLWNPLLWFIILALTVKYQRFYVPHRGDADGSVKEPVERLSEPSADYPAFPDNTDVPMIKMDDKSTPTAEPLTEARVEPLGPAPVPDLGLEATPTADGAESPEKKKKARRGVRGGAKHKKKKNQAPQDGQSSDGRQTPPHPTSDQINKIMAIGQEQSGLQPNIRTLPGNPEELSAGFIINDLQVNTDEQLGLGSNGTVVFAGKFHGRPVAVKRMLNDFYNIASQETRLLLESDSHKNVIQYHALHQDNTFLYIALEKCHCSLADIVEKPHMHRQLAQAGRKDVPNILLQIASGLRHLHNLRIVHRDLKPQNILVTKTETGAPRLVVSDFGLCKKLDGAQSSFGATTAHAAGTSGWRAPELLLDDDARDTTTTTTSSHHSDSSSQLVSSSVMPNRRATRAIDIFSLGLVFFYVLTEGLHPFDCGDRYMREVNIRKGQMNLAPLDVLGDFAYEARDLVRAMLAADHCARPPIAEVMAHPFFWKPKKRLEFLVNVSDHFEREVRDPPSPALEALEAYAPQVLADVPGGQRDFLKALPPAFVDSLGKQRKYVGHRLLDLLRALRNKWNHRDDMGDGLKRVVGTTHDEYLSFWTRRFPKLLLTCCDVVWKLELEGTERFREFYGVGEVGEGEMGGGVGV